MSGLDIILKMTIY